MQETVELWAMEIWFGDDDTAELCSRAAMLAERWGAIGGRAVGRRLLQIEAARTIEALRALPGGLHHDPSDGTWVTRVEGVAIISFELDDGATGRTKTVRVLSVSDQTAGRTSR